jgi:hypothetical protein
MHIHLGLLHGAVVFASVLIYGFFWRLIAAHNADNSVGQGMAFIY